MTVEVGATELMATTASDGTWSVNVGSDASYVVEPSVAVTVGRRRPAIPMHPRRRAPLAVDLTPPSSPGYTVPSSLRVGVAMGALSPSSTSDTDIASYDAAGLPAGLVIAAVTGVISGTPSEAKATETTATVTVTDTGGNTTEEEVTFPVVSKGSQVLSGFSYSSSSVTYGDGEPAVVAPTGAQTPVTYAATPVAVCTVEPDTGALTIVGLGNCVVTASAAGDANYEAAAEVTSTVQVLSAGMLSVALETIADDDIVNAAEHGLGFAISGTVTTGASVDGGRGIGDGGGRRDGADGDDGERRDVVGERRVGCELRGRAERDGDGGGDEDRPYRCIRGDAHARRGPHGAVVARLHGAVVVAGRGCDGVAEPVEYQRHRHSLL